MKEKYGYIALSITIFAEIIMFLTFVFCGGNVFKEDFVWFLIVNTIVSIVLLGILWGFSCSSFFLCLIMLVLTNIFLILALSIYCKSS